ncbi:MAG: hypothetical protein J6P05_01230 [Lachnospiraceae bacterium]|nr:hypothetical protein [Lachnospiraceae bacterium]
MSAVQLGLFQSVLDWVFEHILNPIWNWLSDLLSGGFKVLGDALKGVFQLIFDTVLKSIIESILEWFYMQIYLLEAAILLILDCIEDSFNVVCGLTPIYIGKTRMTLLDAVYYQPTVRKMVGAMIVIGLVLCFFCAILATIRSTLELGGRENKPVTHVLRMAGRSMLVFITIPLVSMIMLAMSGAILNSIDLAMNQGKEKTSIARIIFCISTLDALDAGKLGGDAAKYNSSNSAVANDMGISDKYRKEFYIVNKDDLVPAFANLVRVKSKFLFRKMDFVVGILGAVYFTIIMCMVLFVFIGRIFDVIVLLIVEPLFVAPMPLDDGEHFQKWFALFIGKLFAGFGTIVAMRVYLSVVEMIFTHQISFTDRSGTGARIQDYLISLIFCAGGAYAVQHIGPVITGILSETAAKSEQDMGAVGASAGSFITNLEGQAMAYAGGKMMDTTGQIGGWVTGMISGANVEAAGRAMEKKLAGSGNAFDGKRDGTSSNTNKITSQSGNKFSGERPNGGSSALLSPASLTGLGGAGAGTQIHGSGGAGLGSIGSKGAGNLIAGAVGGTVAGVGQAAQKAAGADGNKFDGSAGGKGSGGSAGRVNVIDSLGGFTIADGTSGPDGGAAGGTLGSAGLVTGGTSNGTGSNAASLGSGGIADSGNSFTGTQGRGKAGKNSGTGAGADILGGLNGNKESKGAHFNEAKGRGSAFEGGNPQKAKGSGAFADGFKDQGSSKTQAHAGGQNGLAGEGGLGGQNGLDGFGAAGGLNGLDGAGGSRSSSDMDGTHSSINQNGRGSADDGLLGLDDFEFVGQNGNNGLGDAERDGAGSFTSDRSSNESFYRDSNENNSFSSSFADVNSQTSSSYVDAGTQTDGGFVAASTQADSSFESGSAQASDSYVDAGGQSDSTAHYHNTYTATGDDNYNDILTGGGDNIQHIYNSDSNFNDLIQSYTDARNQGYSPVKQDDSLDLSEGEDFTKGSHRFEDNNSSRSKRKPKK